MSSAADRELSRLQGLSLNRHVEAFSAIEWKTGSFRKCSILVSILALALYAVFAILLGSRSPIHAEAARLSAPHGQEPLRKKINFISIRDKKRTPNPAGWESYDGSVYTRERGYGWLSQPAGFYASDRGEDVPIRLPGGVMTSPRRLGRLELASWQGVHRENQPLVFRIDLPSGWYRVMCASAGFVVLPLVDQRNFKCRAHDSVFAGPVYGVPLKVGGEDLVEGSNIVEVTDGHLRVVVGDPAYRGWTWSHKGPWYHGWRDWWGRRRAHRYAETWRQKLMRVVDPGFHTLRLNSLEIERVSAPAKQSLLLFRDFFNRDDSSDINVGLPESHHWTGVSLQPSNGDHLRIELYKTSLKLVGPKHGNRVIGVVQKRPSPAKGIVRYSTRVSLFTGEGSKIHSGVQEAGLLILGETAGISEFNSSFIGVAFDKSRTDAPGRVRYRVGNGRDGYRTDSDIPDKVFPFEISEGEYEIIVEHNVTDNILSRLQINGVDITSYWSPHERRQRIPRGLFGIRASMDPLGSQVPLQQFYWFYRVEDISPGA
jgi:hypothetical protein